MTTARVLVILGTLAIANAPAHADYADDAAVGLKMAKRTFDRIRRGIALGPYVGYAGGVDLDGHGSQGISFGLGLYLFEIPTVFDIQEVLAEKIRARVKQRVKDILASGGAAPTDLREIAMQVANDVKQEIMGPIQPKTLEDPLLKVIVEGVALLSPGGFQLRIGAAKGLGPVSLGLYTAFQRSNTNNVWFLGSELSLHLTPIGKMRTPVLDLFARGEYGYDRVNHGDSPARHPIVLTVGLRALVDVL
ncbi:MAG: hypothetical protein IPQ07_27085 [Myxococcales bacterium]|nr:hypothetical protein [Myxococcales bacterium]